MNTAEMREALWDLVMAAQHSNSAQDEDVHLACRRAVTPLERGRRHGFDG